MSGPFGAGALQFFGGADDFYSYKINQSLRFEDGDSAYLSRTPSSATNRTTWTWSVWIKRGNLSYSSANMFGAYYDSNDFEYVRFDSDDCIRYTYYVSGSVQNLLKTSGKFRDTSSWYHILVQRDGSSSEIYVNGVQQDLQTETRASTNGYFNHTVAHNIGRFGGSGQHFDGYMAEMHFVDGTSLNPTSFGETKAGIWIPKDYTGSHGTNGFYLPFDDSSAIGDDESANTNDFSNTNLASTDVVLDSPTNNWCTINLLSSRGTQSEGNLKTVTEASGYSSTVGSMGHETGKWYWEVVPVSVAAGPLIGVVDYTYDSTNSSSAVGYLLGQSGVDSIAYYSNGSTFINGTANSSYGASYTDNDIIGVALNLDDNQITFYKNNSSQGAISYTFSGNHILPAVSDGSNTSTTISFIFNFGQDSSFVGTKTAQGNTDSNGVGDFYYTPPSGFLALCSANLPDPGIDPAQDEEPADHFNTVLYAGNGSTGHAITGVGFQPDWVWLKGRSYNGASHSLTDVVRGVTKRLSSDSSSAETTNAEYLQSFDSDGFTVGNHAAHNSGSHTFVAWNWLAGGSPVSNSDGDITSSVSANTKAGFSIVGYQATGSTATVGHGLSQAPDYIVAVQRPGSAWSVYAKHALGNTKRMRWDTDDDQVTSSVWGNTDPTVDVFTQNVTSTTNNIIAYCFHDVDGYQKIGRYEGNGSTDGTFVYTGFRPAFLMIKRVDADANWIMFDTTRDPNNEVSKFLYPDLGSNEATGSNVLDILSNGFKLRNAGTSNRNASGANYFFWAIAEQPFKYSNAR